MMIIEYFKPTERLVYSHIGVIWGSNKVDPLLFSLYKLDNGFVIAGEQVNEQKKYEPILYLKITDIDLPTLLKCLKQVLPPKSSGWINDGNNGRIF